MKHEKEKVAVWTLGRHADRAFRLAFFTFSFLKKGRNPTCIPRVSDKINHRSFSNYHKC